MNWPKFLIDWLARDSKNWPAIPTVRFGYVRGPVRFEKAGGGGDLYLITPSNKFIVNKTAQELGAPEGYGPTHLQFQSRFGFLILRPFCLHFWFMAWPFRNKEFRYDGSTVPASERGPYWRAGKARWEAGRGIYLSPTWYGPGLHWD